MIAKKIDCLILAAGKGERLRPLTYKIPKPLIPINGKPIIRHIIDYLNKFGIYSITVNLHYFSTLIKDYLKDEVNYSFEPILLGTAGAIKPIENKIKKRLLVVNADTISDVNLFDLFDSHKNSKCLVTIFTKDDAIHTGGMYLFEKPIFRYIPSHSIYSISDQLIPLLIKEGVKINLFKPKDAFYYDCGTPAKLARARKFFRKNK